MLKQIRHDIFDGKENSLHTITTFYSGGIGITIHGYGNKTVVGDAEIVYLDYCDGKLQVVINDKHDEEDPTLVELDGANFVYGDDGE